MDGIVPVILGAIASKTQAGGSESVVDLIRGALAGGNPIDAVAGGGAPSVPLGQANDMTGSIFGTRLPAIVSGLGSAFGLKADAISGLLSFAAPLVLGGIGKALGNNPTPSGLASLMDRERPSIFAALPAGLGSLLGTGGAAGAAAGAATGAADRVHAVPPAPGPAGGIGRWLPWIIGILVVLAILLALSRCHHEGAPVDSASPAATDTALPVAIPTGAGVTTEDRSGKPAVIVYFDTAKADVAPGFAGATDGLKTYLDQNPSAKLSVSGFNDPRGNAAVNAALSKRRAMAVKDALVAAGFDGKRIELVKPADTTDDATSLDNARRVEVLAQ